MNRWTTKDIPDQTGRTVLVTGTGGIGYETALALSRAGAEVILAGRNPSHGGASLARIRSAVPHAAIRFEQVDLASLRSVAAFAERMREALPRLDVLINNAGIMTPPDRRETQDGFELQLGTNHLGHFALTAGLLPLLRTGTGTRVVSLGSVAARAGAIDFDDLNAVRGYDPMKVYSQSKLACLLFAIELQRRSTASGWSIRSVAAHPGISRTDLLPNSAGPRDPARIARRWLPFLFQHAAQGALPILFAATSPDAQPGGYYGAARLGETRGHPAPARMPPAAAHAETARRLWHESEAMTGLAFDKTPA